MHLRSPSKSFSSLHSNLFLMLRLSLMLFSALVFSSLSPIEILAQEAAQQESQQAAPAMKVETRKVQPRNIQTRKQTRKGQKPKSNRNSNRKDSVQIENPSDSSFDQSSETSESTGVPITAIDVVGNKKIEADAVIAKLKSSVGQGYEDQKVREDILSLHRMGFFNDVQVFKRQQGNGVALTFQVLERPSIAEIKFEGNSELKTEELTEQLGIKVYEIINTQKIKDAVEKLQKTYEDKGFFLARIESKVENIDTNSSTGENVRLVFNIRENEKVKVKKITFLGNRQLTETQLSSRMLVQEEGFFSFLSSSGAYKQDVFDASVAFIQRLYYDEGFVNAQVHRPHVYVSPNKKWIYITIRIDEGERFGVGEVDFSGDILFTRDEMLEVMEIQKRDIFSRSVLEKDISELEAKFGDLGYAFANVIPRTRINEAERKVDITFEFDKGSKVYFGRINVVGNSASRDKVVRRELRVREGELYNETRKRTSMDNIKRLGFFEEVNFKTSVLPERQDILNVDIVVKERTTGTLNIGAGYSSATGANLQGQVSQTNFLGKGQNLGAKINFSSEGSFYEFNFTEPYFMDSEWSAGVDVFQSQIGRTDYEEKVLGGAVRFGHPLGDYLSGSVRYGYQRSFLSPTYLATYKEYRHQITDYSIFPLNEVSGDTSSITGTLEFDQRNDRFSPSKGIYASTSLEYAGIGGNQKYTKGVTRFRYFKKLFWEVVWRNNLQYAFISPHDSQKNPPFNELFLLGGPYSLRGYYQGKIGKTAYSQSYYNYLTDTSGTKNPSPLTDLEEAKKRSQRPFGGRQQALFQTEFEFPLVAEAGIKGVFFYDIGQAEDKIEPVGFYSDVGFGFRWFSPLGPLRFEWGFPLRQAEAGSEPVVFEFSIGSPF